MFRMNKSFSERKMQQYCKSGYFHRQNIFGLTQGYKNKYRKIFRALKNLTGEMFLQQMNKPAK